MAQVVFAIVNECNGDKMCDNAGVIGIFDNKDRALAVMKEDATRFYEKHIPAEDRKEYPLKDNGDSIGFWFYDVFHQWHVDTASFNTEHEL